MRKNWWFAMLTLAAIAGTAVFMSGRAGAPAAEVNRGAYMDVNPERFRELLDAGGTVVVNVHVPDQGNIPGTTLSIPYDRIKAEAARLPSDRHAPIAVYCMSGRMSEIAAGTLAELGYKNIFNLSGGMAAWQQAGRPLLQ